MVCLIQRNLFKNRLLYQNIFDSGTSQTQNVWNPLISILKNKFGGDGS